MNTGELIACLKGRLKQIVRRIEQKAIIKQRAVLNPQAAVFNPSVMELSLETHPQNLSGHNDTYIRMATKVKLITLRSIYQNYNITITNV